MQLFHFSAQLVDLSDFALNTRGRRRVGKIIPLLDIFFTNCINLGPHRHVGIILNVNGCRHVQIFQNRDKEIPFPSVFDVDIKAQSDLLLETGSQLNLQRICFPGKYLVKRQYNADVQRYSNPVRKMSILEDRSVYDRRFRRKLDASADA